MDLSGLTRAWPYLTRFSKDHTSCKHVNTCISRSVSNFSDLFYNRLMVTTFLSDVLFLTQIRPTWFVVTHNTNHTLLEIWKYIQNKSIKWLCYLVLSSKHIYTQKKKEMHYLYYHLKFYKLCFLVPPQIIYLKLSFSFSLSLHFVLLY